MTTMDSLLVYRRQVRPSGVPAKLVSRARSQVAAKTTGLKMYPGGAAFDAGENSIVHELNAGQIIASP